MEEYNVYSDYYNWVINESDTLKIDKLVLVDSSSCRYKLVEDDIKRIESELSYPGKIKVTVIRESRFIEYAR